MSDLQGLWDAGIHVPVVHRNSSPSAGAMRAMKEQSGKLTRDAERFVQICQSFNGTIAEPFDQNMGGITMSVFWNPYPQFTDTNNLSLVVFIKYRNFKILFVDFHPNLTPWGQFWLAFNTLPSIQRPSWRYRCQQGLVVPVSGRVS